MSKCYSQDIEKCIEEIKKMGNYNDDIAKMLISTRLTCHKSQRDMAKLLGKSVGTVQNWESGMAVPNFAIVLEWFDILGLNPMCYILDLIHPELSQLTADNSDEEVKNALISYIENDASNTEIRELAFCIFGKTGSCWSSQLEMLTAHNHTPLDKRINIAQSILDNYLISEAKGQLVNMNHIKPDINLLDKAIKNSKIAVYSGKDGYSSFT